MFRIAVCDNDKPDLQLLLNEIEKYLKQAPELDGYVEIFDDPQKLQNAVLGGSSFDVYFLDIIMAGINGIQLGRMIHSREKKSSIIFTTSSREYALDAYGIHAISYLVKPIGEPELFSAIDTARVFWLHKRPEAVFVKTKSGIVSVQIDKIIYVENDVRSAAYVLNDGARVLSVSHRGTFEHAVGAIASMACFVQPHKSFFVNMKYIQTLSADRMTLEDGKNIPVSQKNAATVKRQYLKYLSQDGSDF